MGRDRAQVELDHAGVGGVGVGCGRVLGPARQVRLGDAVAQAGGDQPVGAGAQPGQGQAVAGEPSHQRAPLGGHVADAHARFDRQRGHARPAELDRGVQGLALVVQAAEGDDDVLARDSGAQFSGQLDAHRPRDLPPGAAGGPQGGGVGAHHRGADRAQRAVDVRVAVAGHHEAARLDEAVLEHQLVADAGAGGMEDHALVGGELLDLRVLGQVRLARVLDVVVQGEDRLPRIVHPARAELLELQQHRRGVVVGHDVVGDQGDEVSGVQFGARGQIHGVGLGDLFDDGLGHDAPSPVKGENLPRN